MVFHRKKKSPIDRRLEALHKEMARLGRDLKTVSSSRPGISGPPAAKSSVPFCEGMPPAPAAELEPSAGIAPGAGDDAPQGDLFAHAVVRGAPAVTKPTELFPGLPAKSISPPSSAPPKGTQDPRSGREKFAHYFMAGHFHNLRPSRQESRVVRNKAILMLIAVAALLVWLLYFMRSH